MLREYVGAAFRRPIELAAIGALVAVVSVSAATDTRLVAALRAHDAAAARTLLKQKADVNGADVEGMTPLHWAAHWNDLDLVKALIAAGANARVANRYGVTPLHEACTVGNAAIVNALLKAGANPNAFYGEGETALMIAARTGSTAAVKLLLEAGANANAVETFRGETALMQAAVENHADVAAALIAAGANVNSRTIEYKFQDLVGGAGGIIHDRPQGGITTLMFAARQGALDTGTRLIAAGADVNAEEPQYGFTAMQTALFNGHYAFARLLIDSGASVNDGSLYVAIEMRNLAKYTNRPNPPESERGVSHLDIVKALLDKGANPNLLYWKTIPPRQAQGNINVPAGATPLYRAVRGVDLAAVQLLLDHGADASQAIDDGSTPLMAAAGLGAPRGGDEEVTDTGGKADPVDVIKLLVGKGADVNAVNDAGMTAMHYAVQRGSDRIVEFLAGSGARLDVKNKQGKTAAELARGRTAELVAKLQQ